MEENTAAQIVLDLFEGLVWMDGEGQVHARLNAGRVSCGKARDFLICVAVRSGPTVSLTAEDFVLGGRQRAVDPKTASPFAAIRRRTLTMPQLLLPVIRYIGCQSDG